MRGTGRDLVRLSSILKLDFDPWNSGALSPAGMSQLEYTDRKAGCPSGGSLMALGPPYETASLSALFLPAKPP